MRTYLRSYGAIVRVRRRANLFIYHLPHDLTDADLATAFTPFGGAVSAKVYVNRTTSSSPPPLLLLAVDPSPPPPPDELEPDEEDPDDDDDDDDDDLQRP